MADDATQGPQMKTKDTLLSSIHADRDKNRYAELKNAVAAKLKERASHEKAIKLIDTEIDKLWNDYTTGF